MESLDLFGKHNKPNWHIVVEELWKLVKTQCKESGFNRDSILCDVIQDIKEEYKYLRDLKNNPPPDY